MAEDLAYITAAVILPLIPAYILYRTLPAETRVKGPFKGLNIQLSGAFAGYFLLVVVVFGFVYSRPKIIMKPYEVYEVEGKIEVPPQRDAENIKLSLIPSERNVRPDGSFDFEIPVGRGVTGETTFPSLIIEHPEYEPETVDLRDDQSNPFQPKYHVDFNKRTKTIVVKETILLTKKDLVRPYSPNENPEPIK